MIEESTVYINTRDTIVCKEFRSCYVGDIYYLVR